MTFRALVGIQTPNLLIRSQMLYSVELRAQNSYLLRNLLIRRQILYSSWNYQDSYSTNLTVR